MTVAPTQQDLDDVPQCLRTLAAAIEADPKMAEISCVCLIRRPPSPKLEVVGYGRGEDFSAQCFTECHIGAAQMLDGMRRK